MSIGKEQAETTSHPEKLELEHGLQLEFEPVPVTNNIIPQAEGSSSSCPVNDDVTGVDEKKVLEGLSVLLVEDQAVLQRIGIRMLKKLGAGVTLVKDGEAAVEAMTLMINAAGKNHQIRNLHHGSNLETHNSPHYDLILMDCQMGSMDGCKATRVIRRLEAEAETGQSIPIIAFTALVTADNERECFNSGMDTFLNKPAQEHLLAAAIVETIARKSHKFSCDEQAEAQDEK